MLVFTSAMLVRVLRLMLMLILRRTLPSSFDPSITCGLSASSPTHIRILPSEATIRVPNLLYGAISPDATT